MSEKPQVLFVEDDPAILATFSVGLEAEGYLLDAVSSTEEALTRLANHAYPIVVTDIYLDERTGLDVLKAAQDYNPGCAVIVITGQGTMETVMEATSRGAFEYLAKPFDLSKLLTVLQRAEASLAGTGEKPVETPEIPPTEMVGFSEQMVDVYKTISRAAPTDAPVLILGESGTGKELVARLIHKSSKRADGPFVAVDCGSIAPSLMEAELFGAMRGAYTGAERDRAGLFESAEGGTVFLDEIGEIDAGFQLKLLRFLQEREVRPLGSAKARKLDVRVVAATNRNLRQMVDEGQFREDLWFRLNVVPIDLPPLRERRGDIAALAGHFLERFSARYGRKLSLSAEGLRALEEYTWPGNVRQLQHLLERLAILEPRPTIGGEAVQAALRTLERKERPVESLADAEEEQIRKVLAATGGNKTRAAQILNIERKTLYRKLERMSL
ncbi:MAG: sigma-54 dependent transcriptional regulator [Bryobacterales bacterium]